MSVYYAKAIEFVDRLIEFAEKQIIATQTVVSCPYRPKTAKLKWTGSKVALVELGYALEAAGCVNSGKITLKELFDVLGEVFDVEVKNFARTFIDVKTRFKVKNFLDVLNGALQRKIEAADAKPSRR